MSLIDRLRVPMLVEADRRLLVYPSHDYATIGRWAIAIGVGFALLGALLVSVTQSAFHWSWTITFAVTSLGTGAVFVAMKGSPGTIDPTGRTVETSQKSLRFDDVGCVAVQSVIKRVRTRTGPTEYQRWQLAVIEAEAHAAVQERVPLIKSLAESLPGGKANEAQRAELVEHVQFVRDQLVGGMLLLGSSPNELVVWKVAERLARLIDVPLFDYSGDRPVRRQGRELDLPLEARLAQPDADLPDDVATPEGARVVEDEERKLVLSWSARRWADIAPVLGLALFFLVIGVVLLVGRTPEMGVVGLVAVPLFLFLPVVGRGHGDNRLTVTRDSIVWEAPFVSRRYGTMSLSALELIRVNLEGPRVCVNLFSDERIIVLRGSNAVVSWVRTKVERHLARRQGVVQR